MSKMNERAGNLKRALLLELAHVPAGYLEPEKSLRAVVRLCVSPEPEEAEVDAQLARLEADRLAVCVVDAFGVKRWKATAAGRAALQD